MTWPFPKYDTDIPDALDAYSKECSSTIGQFGITERMSATFRWHEAWDRVRDVIAKRTNPQFDTEQTTLFGRIRQWAADRNLIEGATSQAQTVKLFEEGGEVAHAVARGDRDALKDGIGDMIVVLTILAAQNGLTVEECVAAAYDEIKDRKGRMQNGIFVREVE